MNDFFNEYKDAFFAIGIIIVIAIIIILFARLDFDKDDFVQKVYDIPILSYLINRKMIKYNDKDVPHVIFSKENYNEEHPPVIILNVPEDIRGYKEGNFDLEVKIAFSKCIENAIIDYMIYKIQVHNWKDIMTLEPKDEHLISIHPILSTTRFIYLMLKPKNIVDCIEIYSSNFKYESKS